MERSSTKQSKKTRIIHFEKKTAKEFKKHLTKENI